jgi:hypothetical protein
MKMKLFPLFRDEGEVVASWGEAHLIKYLDGKTELRGGSDQDRAEAREWMSLFWHEAVVGHGSGRRVQDCGGATAAARIALHSRPEIVAFRPT